MRVHECWQVGCHVLCEPGHDWCDKHEQVYWSLTVGGLIVVVIIFAIHYLVGRGFK